MSMLSLGPGEPLTASYGYDGEVTESKLREDWMNETEWKQANEWRPRFTDAERAEIADYMIALWMQFKASRLPASDP